MSTSRHKPSGRALNFFDGAFELNLCPSGIGIDIRALDVYANVEVAR